MGTHVMPVRKEEACVQELGVSPEPQAVSNSQGLDSQRGPRDRIQRSLTCRHHSGGQDKVQAT